MFKKPIHTAFAPNAEKDDILLSVKLLLSNKIDNSFSEKIKHWFVKYAKDSRAFIFSSGRAALYHSLKALNLPEGSEVLIQGFTCVAVPNAILWAGLTPRLVDIDKESYNMDVSDLQKKITEKTRVVLVQHTFGIPAQIDKIMEIAKKQNLIVIEDCAHSLGAHYNTKTIGSYGDIAIFSFGRDKVVSSVFGGVATTKNKNYCARLQDYEQQLVNPPFIWVLKQILYTILYSLSLPLYRVGIGKIFIKLAAVFGFLTPAVYPEEKRGIKPDFINYTFSPRLAHLAYHQLQKLNHYNDHRRQIAKIYQDLLEQQDLVEGAIYLRYPLVVRNKNSLLNVAKNQHIYLGDWYRALVYPTDATLMKQYKDASTCQTAENSAHNTINLPTHINISEDDAHTICDLLKKNQNIWR